jgi:uncharacterized protein YaiI (UPF0178 family)
MKIWVDADACPGAVKDIVITAAVKRKVEAVFVANKKLTIPESPYLSFQLVNAGPDEADFLIANQSEPGDLVITQDIPLAHSLVMEGVSAISPRGVVFSEDNVGERLSVRDLMTELRDTGTMTGGPKPFSDKEKRAFASAFDSQLTKLMKARPNTGGFL